MDNGYFDKLGLSLGDGMKGMEPTGGCIGPEDMAALAEGTLKGEERERVLAHIASCADCREVYMLTVSAQDEPADERSEPAPAGRRRALRERMLPLALAACLLLVAVSVYEYMNGFKKSEVSEQIMAKADIPESGTHELGVLADGEAAPKKEQDEYYRNYGNEAPSPGPGPSAASPPAPAEPEAGRSYGGPEFSDMPEQASETPPVSAMDKDMAAPSMTEMPVEETESAPSWGAQEAEEGYREMPVKRKMVSETEPHVEAKPAPQQPDETATRTAVEKAGMPAGYDKGSGSGEAPAFGSAAVCVPGEKCDTEPAAVGGKEGAATETTETRTVQLRKVSGELKSIDRETGEVLLRPIGAAEDIKIKAADPGDLKNFDVGDMVKVYYEEGEVNLASRIKMYRTVTMPVGC